MRKINLLIILLLVSPLLSKDVKRKIKIKDRYLNFPVSASEERKVMTIEVGGEKLREFFIRLSDGDPDYWVFYDMSNINSKNLTLKFPEKRSGFKKIYQSEQFAGEDSLYKETLRPQFHFTSRRGWNNDPNGLAYYNGEYHLYYQHNPYEILWGNMHWGHAVSKDLVHWEELGIALYPDDFGDMWSGCAVVDHNNTSGFQTGEDPPLVAIYSAYKRLGYGDSHQTNHLAYSNDNGRTLTKYDGNPVLDSKAQWGQNTRDPAVFWHEPINKWVMTLYERNGNSIYHSDDLKDWKHISHLEGFYECPELFELPIDGDVNNTKWVTYGASGIYVLGDFDGYKFMPDTRKLKYTDGALWAAQTYDNIPKSDGRRIQFAWGMHIDHGGKMPFGQLMLLPTELTLKSTPNGTRMYSTPIDELDKLHKKTHSWSNIEINKRSQEPKTTEAVINEELKRIEGDLFRIKVKVELISGNHFQIIFNGNIIADHGLDKNEINGAFYENYDSESRTVELDIFVDRTSVEVFVDGGAFSTAHPLEEAKNSNGLEIYGHNHYNIKSLEVIELNSIW